MECLTTRMNITSLVGNTIVNMFSLNNFIKKNDTSRENYGTPFLESVIIFYGNGVSDDKN